MIITTPGKYRLLAPLFTRNTISCGTIPAGQIIEITQVDSCLHKAIGPKLLGWCYWDIDAESVPKEASDGTA